MVNEITNVGQYNSVGAGLLAKHGNDVNSDHELEVGELKDTLTIGEYKKVAKAGDDDPDAISYLDVLTYEGYKISKEVLDQIQFIPEMVDIPAGTFKMGSINGKDNEQPVREVAISAFKLGKYEVTNAQYLAFRKATFLKADNKGIPASVSDPARAKHPVTSVAWDEANAYCKWLSERTGRKFRLPTEAEWEYVARGNEQRKYPLGSNSRPVGSSPKAASPFGIMDMEGNVAEWVGDCYAEYIPETSNNPKEGPEKGSVKVIRGGSWHDTLTTTERHGWDWYLKNIALGFRVAEDI